MDWWIWILAGLGLLVLEITIPGGIILVFFGVAALVVGVFVSLGLGGPLWFQCLLFSALSVVSLLTLRGPILRRMQVGSEETAVDSLIGQQVILDGAVAPGAEGAAQLRGTRWTVENVGPTALGAGSRAVVERVEGLKLFVRCS